MRTYSDERTCEQAVRIMTRVHDTPAISIDGRIGEHSLDSGMKAPYFNLEEILRRSIDLLETLLPWLRDRLHCGMPVECMYSVYRVNVEEAGTAGKIPATRQCNVLESRMNEMR